MSKILIVGYGSIGKRHMRNILSKKNMNIITKLGGTLLLITGVLIITNHLQSLGFYILEYFPILGSIG